MDEVGDTPLRTPTRHNSGSQRDRRLSSRTARKRSKVSRACDGCKSRKKACTGDIPCRFCLRIGTTCTYDVPYHRGAPVSPRPSTQQENVGTPATTQPTARSDTLQTGPVPTNSAPDGLIDSGGQYRGPTSAHSFLARAMRNFHNHPLEAQPASVSTEDVHESIFSYGDRHAPRVDPSQLQWPNQTTVNRLVKRYFDFASPTYRILHQGTVEEWVNTIFSDQSVSFTSRIGATPTIPPAAEAIILLICAIASLSSASEEPTDQVNIGNLQQYEAYYQMAEQILAKDTGMPYLEFIQARFISVLYLLGASRMNQAWFNFGPTVQLIMAIGLHRKRMRSPSSSLSLISHECSKRVLWCSFTLDQYLSLILGRPRLLHDEDIDQEYPTLVNDENLDAAQLNPSSLRNCLMDAPVCHAKLSRILARASQDLYSIKSFDKDQDIKSVGSLISQITQWQSELPLLFTENVCPSSLITTFRRQLTVIRLAHYHAIMFVTRPLLLWDCSNEPRSTNLNGYLQSCVITARKTLELILDLAKENQFFHSFWYTQYIAFNALSILYIYIIHSCKGRIPHEWVFSDTSNHSQAGPFVFDQISLYELAERTQDYLRQVTEKNALAWRYAIVLDALRSESKSLLYRDPSGEDYQMITPQLEALQRFMVPEQPPVDWEGLQASMTDLATNIELPGRTSLFWGIENLFPSLGTSEDVSLDFWPQLDRLPISLPNPPNV
ncbi:uncharacterized protein N7483_012452 [Penicillium malachiteum]|uniref:uncharacterized protein n=1 Tax=Penicillium malachiteum TaxID=1324776 RepID=UPI00254820D0|nr:uncharacterized protein N7483_012452 [Penicillium malachiteum]KAJ5715271.1 hypothetical protein N7483_012452 [Penicillium malachiteum]